MWFQHLHQTGNRQEGAKKAAITRKEKRCLKKASTSKGNAARKDSGQDICQECGWADPPDCEGDTISWLSCDGCLLWWHITCLGFDNDISAELNRLCIRCSEVW